MPNVRLLLVDDEPSILLTLSKILEKKGFEVTTSGCVPDALKLINTNKFDVLISDLNIGEAGDGFTVVSAMRRVQPAAATFILTGFPDFESALLAIRNQVDDYFTKPADVEEVIERITKRLENSDPPLRSRPPRRVFEILRENADRICVSWLKSVTEDPNLNSFAISVEDRTKHVPEIVQEIIKRLEEKTEKPTPEAMLAAEEHGRARHQQRYPVLCLVHESRILQNKIASTVQLNLLNVDLSRLVPDLVEVGDAITSMLEASIRAYEGEGRAEMRASVR